MATNVQKLQAVFDAIFNGGGSMKRGESLQAQIEQAPVRAFHTPTITGWKNAAGKTYSTSMAQQLAYNAQALARIETRQAAQDALLKQMADALTSGVDLQIDYARIDASIKAAMPEFPAYELTPKETK